MNEHSQLFGAIQSAGVNVVINSPSVCDSETAGAYASRHRVLFVCQEDASAPYMETTWTDYDLDTLRHEAHHMVQDCIAGRLGDERYEPLFDNEYDFEEFIRKNLTQEEIDWILEAYGDQDPEDAAATVQLTVSLAAATGKNRFESLVQSHLYRSPRRLGQQNEPSDVDEANRNVADPGLILLRQRSWD